MTGPRPCCRCQQPTDRAALVLVGLIQGNSGPGGPADYACLPCARVYVRSPLAPDWIGEEIDRTKARLGLALPELSGRLQRCPPSSTLTPPWMGPA